MTRCRSQPGFDTYTVHYQAVSDYQVMHLLTLNFELQDHTPPHQWTGVSSPSMKLMDIWIALSGPGTFKTGVTESTELYVTTDRVTIHGRADFQRHWHWRGHLNLPF